MTPVVRFLPPFVLLSVAIAAAASQAAGRWDGEYRGEGEFDIDRNCIPRKFEATGVVRDNVLYISVRRKGKIVKELKFNITDEGRIPRSFLCSSGNASAFAKGRLSDTEIRLETTDVRSRHGGTFGRTGGTITLSRVSVPQPAPPRDLGATARPTQTAVAVPPPAPPATRPAAPAPRDQAAGGQGGAVQALDPAALIELQRDLKALGYYYGKVDGIFGGGTRGAIAGYQRSRGLPATGDLTEEQLAGLGAEADRAAGRRTAAPAMPEPLLATPRPAPQPAPAATQAPVPAAPPPAGGAIELGFWNSIKDSRRPEPYRAYLEAFPDGHFAPLARLRIQQFGAADARGQDSGAAPAAVAGPEVEFGAYHAVVIGNNDYQHLPKLDMAVSDAVAVSEMLERLYGFKVKLLLNAKRYDIVKSLSEARAELTERDNLLVYYAGHGVIDHETGRGYWLPVDAETDIIANWIGNTTLSDMIKAVPAKHVMIVADSCYSGTLVRAAAVNLKTGGDRGAFVRRMAEKRSRTALVSGGLEPVADAGGGKHSVFAKAFLDALYANREVLEGQGLFRQVQRKVIVNADQTPQYSDIRGAGHDGGDFLFVRR